MAPGQVMQFVVFGDQTADLRPFLSAVLLQQDKPILRSFFQHALIALQQERASLSHAQSRHVPTFSSLLELVTEYYRQDICLPCVEGGLTCLAQLSHFIGHTKGAPADHLLSVFESNHGSYLESSPKILGVCTGLLSAAAVASADSLLSLVPLAVEALRLAFRLGSVVSDAADLLDIESGPKRSWSNLVSGLTPTHLAEEVRLFNDAHGLHGANTLYLSSLQENGTSTVSGPPSHLDRFFNASELLRNVDRRPLTIYGPYHAPHLEHDLGSILSESSLSLLERHVQIQPVIDLVTVPGDTATEVFRSALRAILNKPIRWDHVLQESVAILNNASPSTCRIFAMGPSTFGHSLSSAFKATHSFDSLILEDHLSWLTGNCPPSMTSSKGLAGCNIAIVGMAGRFPDAADHEAYWDLLARGLDVHREVPKDRFDAKAHTDPSGNGRNKSYTPYGCFIKDPGHFDPRFFNMSPREAAQTDPMQRLAIVTAYEAMEASGCVPDRTPTTKAHRVGTFYGQTSDDWREINAAQNIDTYFITGGVRAFGPGRINYHFGFSGPSFSVDTACSSSFAAIQLGCTSLRAGDCDTVFAGGMNVLTNPDIFAGLSKGQFLSKTGSCKTFDRAADGYCRGDGVVTVILKRLEDAVAEHDPILGVIRGTATNHSAEAISITHPHAGAQQYLFQSILDSTGVNARDVNYVEMHGTGTQAGDRIEIESVSSVFAPTRQPRRTHKQPLYIGSSKANIGHGEAVSGVSALVKVMMMLQKSSIPPHCGIKGGLNGAFPTDLNARGVRMADQILPFKRPDHGDRTVFINNFSAAGGNSAMLVQDAPRRSRKTNDPRCSHLVAVSAKSLSSFKNNVRRLCDWLERNEEGDIASLAYTTTARRRHYIYRASFTADSWDLLRSKLLMYNNSSESPRPIPSKASKVVFAFTGQGSHYSGMAKQLFKDSKCFRDTIKLYDILGRSQGFPSIIGLIDGRYEFNQDTSPVITQLSILCTQMALTKLWKNWGLSPDAVIGHSLGEYAAAHAAGVISACDAIRIVGLRAQILEKRCTAGTHRMLAIRGDLGGYKDLLKDLAVDISCINAPDQIVVSGSQDAVNRTRNVFSKSGSKLTELNVPFAFHSAQVDPILDQLEKVAGAISFHTPAIPILSPTLGGIIDKPDIFNASYLKRHCRDTVNFTAALRAAESLNLIDDKTVWVEIGPHPVCTSFIQSTYGSGVTTATSLRRGEDTWRTISAGLSTLYAAGIKFDWSAYHQEYEHSLSVLSLPTYAFDNKNYWLDYVGNWTLIKGDNGVLPSVERENLKFSTTSVQKIVEEAIEDGVARATGESDLNDKLLNVLVRGHQVNDAPLCPSSLNADMAMTICNHMHQMLFPDADFPCLNVGNMESHTPLVYDETATSQILRVSATYDPNKQSAQVTFTSILNDTKVTEHSKCIVMFENSSQRSSEFQRSTHLVKERINLVRAKPGINTIHRGMAYKLFAALVDYDAKFRGMEEVRLDSEQLEATARISFQATENDGNYFMSPYFIDSVSHIAGFVMNANDALDSANNVYISHGWESMRFTERLDPSRQYQSYVRMTTVNERSKMVAGDVYVLNDNSQIMGIVGGLKFQCIPRKLMTNLLGPKKIATSAPQDFKQSSTFTARASRPLKSTLQPTSRKMILKPSFSDSVHGRPTESSNISIVSRALDVIAEEIGCSLNELDDNVQFIDLGVDSLMGLTISSKFRENLDLDLDSSVFLKFDSVGLLKSHIAQTAGQPSQVDSLGLNDDDEEEEEEVKSRFDEYRPKSKNATIITPPDSSEDEDDEIDSLNVLRYIIAREMNVDIEEIADEVDLSSIGLDSLMALSILGNLREETGVELSSDFLLRCPSVGMMRESPEFRPASSYTDTNPLGPVKDSLDSYPAAECILLQGNPKSSARKLFFLPDGSGSATAYAPIPRLDAQTAVYALNCPFMRNPQEFTCGIETIAQIYIKSIKARQPSGPYLLAGWSAGGVLAYELTRQFVLQGQTVNKLVLIDSPFPIGLEALPPVFHQFCNTLGLLGDGNTKIPSWLLPHFRATVRELTNYSDKLEQLVGTIDQSKMPQTTCIWAQDGVVRPDGPRPDWDESKRVPNSMYWLCNDRTDLGPNGWDRLVGGAAKVRCASMPGNHFTMMRKPLIDQVGVLVKEALDA